MPNDQGKTQMHGLYEQEKFREMPTKELRDCIQQDEDSTRAQRAQKVLSERGDPSTARFDEGNVKQGGGQRGMREEGGQQPQSGQAGFGDERTRGDQRDVRGVERDH